MREVPGVSDAARPNIAAAAQALRPGNVARSVVSIVLVMLLTSCVPIGVRVQNMLALTG